MGGASFLVGFCSIRILSLNERLGVLAFCYYMAFSFLVVYQHCLVDANYESQHH